MEFTIFLKVGFMKHHYCPSFYTGHWKNENGKIFSYSIKNNKVVCHDITPQNTGYEIDLYAKTNIPEGEKHAIELQCYKEIDDKAAKIHRKILNHDVHALTKIEKNDWCRFIVSMMTRHSSIVFDTKSRGANTIKKRAQILTPAQRDHFKNKIDYLIDNIGIETLAAIVTPENVHGLRLFERYHETLLKMCWWIEDFSSTDFMLLTSDYPATLAPLWKPSQKYKTPTDMLLSGEYLFSLPLNPHKCFYVCADPSKIVTTPNKLIKMQNQNTIHHAKNFVYSKNRSQENFIKKRLSSRLFH